MDFDKTGKWVKGQYENKKEMSVFALIVALISGGGGFAGFTVALDLADARWMTYEQHAIGDMKSYIRDLKRDIRELEYDKRQGTATERDLWELDQLRDDLEDAEDELE